MDVFREAIKCLRGKWVVKCDGEKWAAVFVRGENALFTHLDGSKETLQFTRLIPEGRSICGGGTRHITAAIVVKNANGSYKYWWPNTINENANTVNWTCAFSDTEYNPYYDDPIPEWVDNDEWIDVPVVWERVCVQDELPISICGVAGLS